MEATYVEEWFSDDRFAVVSLPTGAFEDGGHAQLCDDVMEMQIRVGAKPDRPFDITPCPDNPNSPPPHVWEHDALVAQRLPAQEV